MARYDTPISVSDIYGQNITQSIGQINGGEIYRTTYQGPYGHLYAQALNVVLNVNFYEDGTGEIAAGSYYPTEELDSLNCTADIAILPITDILEYTSSLEAGHTIPSTNILGSAPDGDHDHPSEGYTEGILIHAGEQAGSISLSLSEYFDLFPSTPVHPSLCDDIDESGNPTENANCFNVTLENGETISGGDPLPGFSGGYVLKGNLSSIAPAENYCADAYIEWHAIDGPISGTGLGDIPGEDEDGDFTDFDRIWAMETLMATYLNPSCGFNYPIFGDVTDLLEGTQYEECIDRVDRAVEGYIMNSQGFFFTYNVENNIPGDDSDHDFNGTDGRLVMQFESECIQDINIRHIMLEFMEVGGVEGSCLDGLDGLSGCTDSEAYNCADDDASTNYIFDIGGIMYDNSCNWEWNTDTEEADYVGGCESGINALPCEGYYNPWASIDDGSCRYWQAPHGDEVVITPACGISVDWSAFSPPENAILESYHVQRCLGTGCTWITGFGIGDANTETSFIDEYDYEEGVEIKYAIAVKYSNNPYWGWAIGASYITPGSPPASGDMNNDGVYNVLDIVALANCVLTGNCEDLENGCAGDMNSDDVYNILDIVNLANCVLAGNCG